MPVEQQRRLQRHERILDAASHVFATKGYHAALVDDIAAEAQTSKGGIYFHFPTKQAIFLALLDRLAAMLRERIDAAVARESAPLDRAEAALRVVLETMGHHRRLARLFLVEALAAGPEFHSRLLAMHAAFSDLIQGYLDEAVAAGAIAPVDTRVTAVAWFGAVNELVTRWALTDGAPPLEDAFPEVRRLLLRGVLADAG